MKMKVIAVVILAVVVAAEAEAKDQIHARFRPLWGRFGEKSTTKLKIVTGPEDVKMRHGGVAGRRWIATCGDYRFKLTIETVTGVTLDTLVKRIEQLPEPYMKACVAVSDEHRARGGTHAGSGDQEHRSEVV